MLYKYEVHCPKCKISGTVRAEFDDIMMATMSCNRCGYKGLTDMKYKGCIKGELKKIRLPNK